MSATRYASVIGLGFGDCGKGHFIDALTRRWQAHTVVRFNGGGQAGHNVVVRADGGSGTRHHTFSQFGSGTFVAGTGTLLLDPMVVHPTALLAEAGVLGRIGIADALSRLGIDANCRVTTPYHQAAGRLREQLRGAAAHGTCGVGVGETVRHALEHPELVLRYGDLPQSSAAHGKSQMERLQAIRELLLDDISQLCPADCPDSLIAELQVLHDETLAGRWLNHARALARQCPPASAEELHAQLARPGCVLFEGAQGVLLDEGYGFHPHTTWSSTTTAAVDRVAARFGIMTPIQHLGVLRCYMTRHGVGPLPTYEESLDDRLTEPHNHADGWQGPFRRGHPDAVLLRYALEAAGDLSGLLVGHLDVFKHGMELKWCERYAVESQAASLRDVARLPLAHGEDLNHQMMLTALLSVARPQYAEEPVISAQAYLDRLASVTPLPVIACSYGAGNDDVVHDRIERGGAQPAQSC